MDSETEMLSAFQAILEDYANDTLVMKQNGRDTTREDNLIRRAQSALNSFLHYNVVRVEFVTLESSASRAVKFVEDTLATLYNYNEDRWPDSRMESWSVYAVSDRSKGCDYNRVEDGKVMEDLI